jgi:hypothetical protein
MLETLRSAAKSEVKWRLSPERCGACRLHNLVGTATTPLSGFSME